MRSLHTFPFFADKRRFHHAVITAQRVLSAQLWHYLEIMELEWDWLEEVVAALS